MTRYRTIVADPPWDHSDGTGKHVDENRITHLPYDTMTLTDIAALPVYDLSDNVDHDAHLYLWTTSRYLPDAYSIVRAWGFHYTATLVWCKAPRGWALGGQYQNNVEFCIFARRPQVTRKPEVLRITTAVADAADARGITHRDVNRHMGYAHMAMWWLSRVEHRCACPTNEQWPKLRDFVGLGNEWDAEVSRINAKKGTEVTRTPQGSTTRWFTWPRGEHSAKPEAFLDLVEQVSPAPRLELFARRQRLGWDTWGNEALNHVEMGS